jgi:hypothetical protein
MWHLFDLAVENSDQYLSIVVATKDNKNVTEDQLKKMMSRIPEDERDRWLAGARPEGKGNFFSKPNVYACEDDAWGRQIVVSAVKDHPGYFAQHVHSIGIVHYQVPLRGDELYVQMGDPGIDGAPKRNSPVIMVWGVPVTFPENPARLVSFWWGNGHGAITPFVNQFLALKQLYDPVIAGIDATGPQKNMAELINIQYLGVHDADFSGKAIIPMDFSGSKKSWYLHALRLLIEAQKLRWPKNVIGIRSQLTNYDPARDGKIAQDIVATMGMSAFAIRSYFYVDIESENSPSDGENTTNMESYYRLVRLPAENREQRGVRR